MKCGVRGLSGCSQFQTMQEEMLYDMKARRIGEVGALKL